MKSCEHYELLASLVLDQEASETEQAELKKHLETCPACRAYFEDIQKIHRSFDHEEIVVPQGFALRVMDRVRETKQEPSAKNRKTVPFPRWKRWTALAACCAVVALSAWAFRNAAGGRDNVISTDPGLMTAADTGTPSMEAPFAAQDTDPVPLLGEADGNEEGAAPEETPAAVPEEYTELAKSAARDGENEDVYQPVAGTQSGQGPALSSSPPPEDVAEDEVLPVPETPSGDSDVPESNGGEPEDALPSPAEPVVEETDAPDEITAAAGPAAADEDVEPVEVVGVPEPGILVAYGNAAQEWVERVLGLDWATGGSYPLTAEQYGDLLRTLDEAGEHYSIAPGEGYCLMTE